MTPSHLFPILMMALNLGAVSLYFLDVDPSKRFQVLTMFLNVGSIVMLAVARDRWMAGYWVAVLFLNYVITFKR